MYNIESDKIISQLNQYNEDLDSLILKDIIESTQTERERLQSLWNRYLGDTPIKSRINLIPGKVNSKLSNNFRYEIIEQGVSYFCGTPIKYDVTKDNYSDEQYQKILKEMNSFNKLNYISDLDMITTTYSSTTGYGSRLLYIDTRGKLRTMNLKPWESIFIYDSTLDELQVGLILYLVDYVSGGKTYKRWTVEVYDKTNVRIYFEEEKGKFVLNPIIQKPVFPHLFNNVPMIKFENNSINTGDFEMVEDLIDSYDINVSDASDELQEFRLAYLAFINGTITEDELAKAKKTGAFNIKTGNKEAPADIKWLTKDLPSEFLEKQKETLKKNIYKFSMSVDFGDPVFQTNAESGIARVLKLLNLEGKRIIKERKFTKALNEQFRLQCDIWNKKDLNINPDDFELKFTRNLPIDLSYYANFINMGYGKIPLKTLYNILPFIDSPEDEFNKLVEEKRIFGNSFEKLNEPVISGSV